MCVMECVTGQTGGVIHMALTALNLLSARKVETAQPRPKVYQLRDGGSLFLRVQPNGSKLWWYRYRLGGAEQVYSIGVYPKVTLEAARAERDRAKALVKKGLDPIVEKRKRSPPGRHTNARSRPLLGVDRQQCSLERVLHQTRSPATLRRMFSPDWQVADQQHQGSTSAPHHQGCGGSWREDCGDPHPPVVWANLQSCGCPRSLRIRSCRLAQGTGQAPSGPPQPSG